MKYTHYILLMACALCASCMDDKWESPTTSLDDEYGNPAIKELNVTTIQALKTKYKTEISELGKYRLITEDVQVKGYVTGNDIQGNFYNEIAIQDETGGIFIDVAQGGVFAYLPLGTEILVNLKGLYIGNYRRSATIGTLYTDKDGNESVSRMPRALWHQHFTYTGRTKNVTPEVFADGSAATSWDITMDAGKLGVLKNVTIKNGGYYNSQTEKYVSNVPFTPTSTFSVPGFSTSWYFNEQPDGSRSSQTAVQIYNSNYADFAAMPLPHGKVNVTGVFKHYCNAAGNNDQWEIIIRSIDDVETAE